MSRHIIRLCLLLGIGLAVWSQEPAPPPASPAPQGQADETAPAPQKADAVAAEDQTGTETSDTAQVDELAAAFAALAQGANGEAAETARTAIVSSGAVGGNWPKVYKKLFEQAQFTPALAGFWRQLLGQGGAEQELFARASGMCAAEALAAAWRAPESRVAALFEALGWLDFLAQGLSPPGLDGVAGALERALTGTRPPNLIPFLGGAPPVPPRPRGVQPEGEAEAPPVPPEELMRAAWQTCLTLRLYADPMAVTAWIQLPQPLAQFWTNTDVLVFDNGMLTGPHLASLESLLLSVPPELHPLAAVVVPEGVGAESGALGLRTPGVLLDIPFIPMEAMSDPSEFVPRVGQAAAPEFTLAAALELMRLIQSVQFSNRPELVHRRNTILNTARFERTRYLRRFLPPATYQANPDALVPLTSYLYFLDSERAFFMAMELLGYRENEALDAVMLVADVLSGGGNTTPLFHIDPAGIVSSAPARIQRTLMEPGLPYASALAVDGYLWVFEFNARGGIMRYYRM